MNGQHPRVAFFPDAFHEVDGVAVVARNFVAYARDSNIPLLIVHAGPHDQVVHEGSVIRMELRRSPIKFPLDRNHEFDLILLRRYRKVAAQLEEFSPDLIQITGPSDIGILGAMCAHKIQIPLSAFWQTNLPQYAGLRVAQAVKFLPKRAVGSVSRAVQQWSHRATTRFYQIPRILFAPNPEIVQRLAEDTGKPCFPMGHGVDTHRFSPEFRDSQGAPFTIGYVGRLTAEKNVRWLARLEQALLGNGLARFQDSDCRSWRRAGVARPKYAPRRILRRVERRRVIARVREHGRAGIPIPDGNLWFGCAGSPRVRSTGSCNGRGRSEVHDRTWEDGLHRGKFRRVCVLRRSSDERSGDGFLHARSGAQARAREFLGPRIPKYLPNVSFPPGRCQSLGN